MRLTIIACRLTWVFLAIWIAFTVTFYWLDIFSLLLFLPVALLGIVATMLSVIAAVRSRDRRAYWASGVAVLVMATWVVVPTRAIGAYARALVESPRYAAAVKQLSAGDTPACLAAKTCYLDQGPPRRLAFSYGGIVDNWVGVIYDPEDRIVNAPAFRSLFGDTLVGCDRLWGHYYFCGFT